MSYMDIRSIAVAWVWPPTCEKRAPPRLPAQTSNFYPSEFTSATLFIAYSAYISNWGLSRSFFHIFIYLNDIKINLC